MKIYIATFLSLASHTYAYSKELKGQALCSYGDTSAMVNLYGKVRKKTPKEVEFYVNNLAKRYGTDQANDSGVTRKDGAYKQTFYLSNSLTSNSISVKCLWTTNVQF